MELNVLHVNNIDLYGRRFNGYDLLADLRPRGIRGSQAVLTKQSSDPRVFSLWKEPYDRDLHSALVHVERRRSMNNLLFPWGRVLETSEEFAAADVVHYHLLHNQVIGLFDLPRLFATKPSVWTFHDPWPMTGHCIYPKTSDGWLSGCHNCPFLTEQFPLERDYSNRMWRVKRRVLADATVDIVVASEFMRDMVARSPITSHLKRVHLIPFGVDPSAYLEDDKRLNSREALGIPAGDLVLMFRSTTSSVKGLTHIVEALRLRPPTRPTTLLTVDQRGLVRSLSDRYRIVELGWVDGAELARAYSAADMLLMPSSGEAFGLMAIEAMAAGRPVISFEGTALPGVTRSPDCGISVPMGDSVALREAIDTLTDSPEEVRRRGVAARAIAMTDYAHEKYLDRLVALYTDVASRDLT